MDLKDYISNTIIDLESKGIEGLVELEIATTIHQWYENGDPRNIKHKIIVDPTPNQYSNRIKFSVILS